MAGVDSSFNATGPTITGFETTGTDMDNGVVAGGRLVGVRGLCQDGNAVEGLSGRSVGVFGLAGDNQSGVVGLTRGAMGAGVFGIHLNFVGGIPSTSTIQPTFGSPGTGVYGFSKGGVGVVAEGETGLAAISTADDPGHAAIVARGFKTIGIFSSSRTNRAAVFTTGDTPTPKIFSVPSRFVPQVHLAPIEDRGDFPRPNGPTTGVAGDAIAIKNLQGQCELWFCVQSEINAGGVFQKAFWKQVV